MTQFLSAEIVHTVNVSGREDVKGMHYVYLACVNNQRANVPSFTTRVGYSQVLKSDYSEQILAFFSSSSFVSQSAEFLVNSNILCEPLHPMWTGLCDCSDSTSRFCSRKAALKRIRNSQLRPTLRSARLPQLYFHRLTSVGQHHPQLVKDLGDSGEKQSGRNGCSEVLT